MSTMKADSPNRYAAALDVTPGWAKAAGYTFTRKLCGTKYAVNGNAHRPTPEYSWTASYRGTPVATWESYRSVVTTVKEWVAEGTDPRV